MKSRFVGLVLPTVFATILGSAEAGWSQTVATPLASPVVVQGQSGGSQSSSCGNIAAAPNQRVQVTEAFTSLQFQLSGAPSSTLLVTTPGGQNYCVMANPNSGEANIPGLWDPGVHSVYVGERGNGSHPFTLTIVQE